jgi:hypothetical protein
VFGVPTPGWSQTHYISLRMQQDDNVAPAELYVA